MIQAKSRVIIQNDENFFGPGVAVLFRQIQEQGSINKATRAMGMSYSKGWKMIKRAEKELGFPMLTRQIGGSNGGSSALTEEGLDFLNKYDALQKKVQADTNKFFAKYFDRV